MTSPESPRFRRALIGCNEALPPARAAQLCRDLLDLEPLTTLSAAELSELADREQPDLLMSVEDLSDGSAITVIRELRERGYRTPAVILSRDPDVNLHVAAYGAGVDLYMVWPSDVTAMQLRVRALIRRCNWERAGDPGAAGPASGADTLTVGDVTLDPQLRVASRGGTPVHLSRTEYALLEFFMRHPRQVLSREQLLASVWGSPFASKDVVNTYVRYLRKKLDPLGPPAVHTRRGHGYLFDPELGA
ncbi:response regulator transcription factor [Streptomyces sp. Je 1-332]|uniref:response regulator transcription factor n=1 Tax=Streptomyces sp. Je 1-332 TaxID=3231270 RepID=UPI003458C89D